MTALHRYDDHADVFAHPARLLASPDHRSRPHAPKGRAADPVKARRRAGGSETASQR